jgi:hypothetical protein
VQTAQQPEIRTKIPAPISLPIYTPMPMPALVPVPILTPAPRPAPVLPPILVAPVNEETKKKPQRSAPSRIITGRLALDDALKQVQDCRNDDKAAFDGWSDARLRAYKMIDKNPNSYYYRFNAPGEQQKKGKWSDEENALFLSRLAELGANSQWGIFSIAIPGRVGYQVTPFLKKHKSTDS